MLRLLPDLVPAELPRGLRARLRMGYCSIRPGWSGSAIFCPFALFCASSGPQHMQLLGFGLIAINLMYDVCLP